MLGVPLQAQYEKMSNLIIEAHAGQKYGGKPYTYHLRMVDRKCEELFGEDLSVEDLLMLKICSLGHDLIEDTKETKQSLLDKGFDPLIVASIDDVTKKVGQGYSEYLMQCSLHWLPFYTKLADTYCNLTESLKSDSSKRARKYSSQIEKLYKKRAIVEESYGG